MSRWLAWIPSNADFSVLDPQIAAVEIGIENIALRAVQRLRQMIEQEDRRVYTPPRLLVRGSVRSLKP